MVIGFSLALDRRGADRPDDGPRAARRGVLQSAADDHLSGAEGRADAADHAVARRRRCLEDAGDLPRRQPAGDLSRLSGRARGGGEDALVRRRDGASVRARAPAAHRVSRGAARDHGRHPHRAGARADHHGDERDDRAQAGRRRPAVQRARDGAVRDRLRHHHHHRHARLRDRRGCSRGCASASSPGPSRRTTSRWARHDGGPPHRRDRHRHPADRAAPRAVARARGLGRDAGRDPAAAGRRVRAPAAAVRQCAVLGQRRDHAVPAVLRLLHRGRDRRLARARGDRQPAGRVAGAAAGARARAAAEGRALSGDDPDPRLRPCLQDHAGRGRRRVPDPARDLSGHGGGRAEARLVGARRRHVAARARCSRWC